MATTVKVVRDTRREKEDGTYPVVLRLVHNRDSRNIPLGYSVSNTDWNEKEKAVKSSYANSTRVNYSINKKLTEAKKAIIDNENRIDTLTIDEVKALITSSESSSTPPLPEKKELTFYEFTDTIITRLEKSKRYGSVVTYGGCKSSIKKFAGENLLLSDIDYKFLLDYEADCLSHNLKINSIGNYLRSLRAVLNLGIAEGLLKQEQYPFKKFRIKKEKTKKRAISKDNLKSIFSITLPVESNLWHSQNYFTFMFNMRGMNFIDIAYLKMNNLQMDRVIYTRLKTKKQYNIKLTEVARKILAIYIKDQKPDSEEYIFPIISKEVQEDSLKTWKRAIDRRKYFNIDLKKIAAHCGIETNLTSYVSRHSWASIAKFSGVSTSIIGESLGHSDSKTTEAYLADFEQQVLDEANELIVS